MFAPIARLAAPRAAPLARLSSTLSTASKLPSTASASAAATASGSSANLTTAASLSEPAPAAQRHTVNLAGKVISRRRMFATNASESLPGLSELTPAQARAQRAQHRMRDAKALAGIC